MSEMQKQKLSEACEKLSQYEVCHVIGSGSFGTCYKVKHRLSNQYYVWKVIDYGEMTDARKKLLVSEVNVLSDLRSDYIVRYHDRIIRPDTTTIYIVMEFCPGGDLASLIKKCRRTEQFLTEKFIWKVVYQLGCALHTCHSRLPHQVLHRDIKPANVFLDANKNVKLGDFGLARILRSNEESFSSTIVGTPYYMSPEVIKGDKYNVKSDIWALGCLIYELCSWSPPFKGDDIKQLSKQILSQVFYRIPLHYSNDLQTIIIYMLRKNTDIRPNIATLLTHPLLMKHAACFRRQLNAQNCASNNLQDNKNVRNISYNVPLETTNILKNTVTCRNDESVVRVKTENICLGSNEPRTLSKNMEENENEFHAQGETTSNRQIGNFDTESSQKNTEVPIRTIEMDELNYENDKIETNPVPHTFKLNQSNKKEENKFENNQIRLIRQLFNNKMQLKDNKIQLQYYSSEENIYMNSKSLINNNGSIKKIKENESFGVLKSELCVMGRDDIREENSDQTSHCKRKLHKEDKVLKMETEMIDEFCENSERIDNLAKNGENKLELFNTRSCGQSSQNETSTFLSNENQEANNLVNSQKIWKHIDNSNNDCELSNRSYENQNETNRLTKIYIKHLENKKRDAHQQEAVNQSPDRLMENVLHKNEEKTLDLKVDNDLNDNFYQHRLKFINESKKVKETIHENNVKENYLETAIDDIETPFLTMSTQSSMQPKENFRSKNISSDDKALLRKIEKNEHSVEEVFIKSEEKKSSQHFENEDTFNIKGKFNEFKNNEAESNHVMTLFEELNQIGGIGIHEEHISDKNMSNSLNDEETLNAIDEFAELKHTNKKMAVEQVDQTFDKQRKVPFDKTSLKNKSDLTFFKTFEDKLEKLFSIELKTNTFSELFQQRTETCLSNDSNQDQNESCDQTSNENIIRENNIDILTKNFNSNSVGLEILFKTKLNKLREYEAYIKNKEKELEHFQLSLNKKEKSLFVKEKEIQDQIYRAQVYLKQCREFRKCNGHKKIDMEMTSTKENEVEDDRNKTSNDTELQTKAITQHKQIGRPDQVMGTFLKKTTPNLSWKHQKIEDHDSSFSADPGDTSIAPTMSKIDPNKVKPIRNLRHVHFNDQFVELFNDFNHDVHENKTHAMYEGNINTEFQNIRNENNIEINTDWLKETSDHVHNVFEKCTKNTNEYKIGLKNATPKSSIIPLKSNMYKNEIVNQKHSKQTHENKSVINTSKHLMINHIEPIRKISSKPVLSTLIHNFNYNRRELTTFKKPTTRSSKSQLLCDQNEDKGPFFNKLNEPEDKLKQRFSTPLLNGHLSTNLFKHNTRSSLIQQVKGTDGNNQVEEKLGNEQIENIPTFNTKSKILRVHTQQPYLFQSKTNDKENNLQNEIKPNDSVEPMSGMRKHFVKFKTNSSTRQDFSYKDHISFQKEQENKKQDKTVLWNKSNQNHGQCGKTKSRHLSKVDSEENKENVETNEKINQNSKLSQENQRHRMTKSYSQHVKQMSMKKTLSHKLAQSSHHNLKLLSEDNIDVVRKQLNPMSNI